MADWPRFDRAGWPDNEQGGETEVRRVYDILIWIIEAPVQCLVRGFGLEVGTPPAKFLSAPAGVTKYEVKRGSDLISE
jgi:hypothetical protein